MDLLGFLTGVYFKAGEWEHKSGESGLPYLGRTERDIVWNDLTSQTPDETS
jgi:hypothetical protein